jgi:hypothetical protein
MLHTFIEYCFNFEICLLIFQCGEVFGLEQESIIGILHKFLSHGLILLFQGKIEIDFLGFGFPIIDDSTVIQPLI